MTIEYIQESLAEGLSLAEIAAKHGGTIRDGILIPEQPWIACDGCGDPLEGEQGQDADSLAREYVHGVEWGDDDRSLMIEVETYHLGVDEAGDVVKIDSRWHSIERPAAEPSCSSEEGHDWKSAGAIGRAAPYGTGVVTTETCSRCGARRITDTGAHTDSGKEFTQVRYEAGDYAA